MDDTLTPDFAALNPGYNSTNIIGCSKCKTTTPNKSPTRA
jgi:hypothetical protein